MDKSLFEKLKEYSDATFLPMHMPGGKRKNFFGEQINPFSFDITEIEGFDNLHAPKDILLDEMNRASSIFKFKDCRFLVNGSSVGILSAVCGTCDPGDKVLIARNSHISVFNAIEIKSLNPVFIYPSPLNFSEHNLFFDPMISKGISVADIENNFKKHNDIKAVIITSPTYEGFISDIKQIASVVHKYNSVLIVDQAHGAHFSLNSNFPESASVQGADIVVISTHKTLPTLTQTGIIGFCSDRIDFDRINHYLDIFQTTSPSYLLLSSISKFMDEYEKQGPDFFNSYIDNLKLFKEKISALNIIKLIESDDISKIVLSLPDAKFLYDRLLNNYKIQVEMSSFHYIIAMTSVMDSQSDFGRFLDALFAIDKECQNFLNNEILVNISSETEMYKNKCINENLKECNSQKFDNNIYFKKNDTTFQNHKLNYVWAYLVEAKGKVAYDAIFLYPPGIPLVNKGERIDENTIQVVLKAVKCGIHVPCIRFDEKGRVLIRCL